jgi:hypothetical protein
MGFFSNLGKTISGFAQNFVDGVKSFFKPKEEKEEKPEPKPKPKPEPEPEPEPQPEPEPEEIENDWLEMEETTNPHIISP